MYCRIFLVSFLILCQADAHACMLWFPAVAYPQPGQQDVPLDARIWISTLGADTQGAQNVPSAIMDENGRQIALEFERVLFLDLEYRLLKPAEALLASTTYRLVLEDTSHTFTTSSANQAPLEAPPQNALRQHARFPMFADDCGPNLSCRRFASFELPGAHSFRVALAGEAANRDLATPGALPMLLPFGSESDCLLSSDTRILFAHVGVNGAISPFVDLGRVDGVPDAGCECASSGEKPPLVLVLLLAFRRWRLAPGTHAWQRAKSDLGPG